MLCPKLRLSPNVWRLHDAEFLPRTITLAKLCRPEQVLAELQASKLKRPTSLQAEDREDHTSVFCLDVRDSIVSADIGVSTDFPIWNLRRVVQNWINLIFQQKNKVGDDSLTRFYTGLPTWSCFDGLFHTWRVKLRT